MIRLGNQRGLDPSPVTCLLLGLPILASPGQSSNTTRKEFVNLAIQESTLDTSENPKKTRTGRNLLPIASKYYVYQFDVPWIDQSCHSVGQYLGITKQIKLENARRNRLKLDGKMTKPRKKPNTNFHAFLVEPNPGFTPTNWRQNPEHYRILKYVGPKHFKGRADAWKFLHNHDRLHRGPIRQWAIYLDFDSPFSGAGSTESDTTPVSIRSQNLASIQGIEIQPTREQTLLR